jgi:hypothetical protein
MDEKTLFVPLAPTEALEEAAPPAPTVTLYDVAETENVVGDVAQDASAYPPAPPPPELLPEPPAPPPPITSTSITPRSPKVDILNVPLEVNVCIDIMLPLSSCVIILFPPVATIPLK